jgi:hypothetical protein
MAYWQGMARKGKPGIAYRLFLVRVRIMRVWYKLVGA